MNTIAAMCATRDVPERLDYRLRSMLRNEEESPLVRGAIVSVYRAAWNRGKTYANLDRVLLDIWLGSADPHGGALISPIEAFFAEIPPFRTHLLSRIGMGLFEVLKDGHKAAILQTLRRIADNWEPQLDDDEKEAILNVALEHQAVHRDAANAISWRLRHRGLN